MIEEFKSDTVSKKKYVCKYDYEYSDTSMCNFVSKLGKQPEKYEIISLSVNNNGRYELFYKEYIN